MKKHDFLFSRERVKKWVKILQYSVLPAYNGEVKFFCQDRIL